MSHPHTGSHPYSDPSRWLRVARIRLHFTFSHLWRLLLVFLMSSLYVMGMWAGFISPAYAATLIQRASVSQTESLASPPPRRGTHPKLPAATVAPCPFFVTTPAITGTVDGLGTLGLYTLLQQHLNERKELEVNVANGNLVLQATDLQIRGTGLNLDILTTYNSLATTLGPVGQHWNLNVGSGVWVQNNPDQSVTFHGPTGLAATFPWNGAGYDSPPGLDARMYLNSDNSHTLIFEKTGECLGFDVGGHEIFDQDSNNNLITFSYDSSFRLTSLVDTQNRVTTFGYNANGQINLVTDPLGRTLQYHYDSTAHNMTSSVDTNGKTTTFGYSGHDLTSITDPESHTTTIAYSNHQVTSITDATGAKTSYAYLAAGSSSCTPLSSTLPCTTVTDANGHTTTYAYNGLMVEKVQDANGNMQSKNYTPDDNVSQYTDALGDISVFNFNNTTNNLTSIVDGNSATTTFGYTNVNPYLITSQQDPQGNTLTYGYSGRNLTSVQDSTSGGTGTSTSYTYNSNGTLASATDGDGHTTSYGYDQYGNLTSVTPPSPLGKETLVVDGVSRVTSVTDGNNLVTLFTYDPLDHVTKIAYNNGNGGSISYTFDNNGNQLSVVDNTGTTSFQYDPVNRITKKTLPSGATITTDYDGVGNLTSFTDAGGQVMYSYTKVNLLDTLTEPDGQQTHFAYNHGDQRTQETLPNGVVVNLQYDHAGHQTSNVATHSSTTLFSESYSYFTLSGNKPTTLLQTRTDNISHDQQRYSYDSMNRLLKAPVFNSSNVEVDDYEYTYDKAGNRLSDIFHLNGLPTAYTYNAANELVTAAQSGQQTLTYSYDGQGNLLGSSPTGQSYTYNNKNQTKTIGSNSYTYSGASQADRVQINGLTLVYSGLGVSSQTDSSGTTYFTRCSCSQLLNERLPSGKKYYYLFDERGSIVGLTDSTGAMVNTYEYDPFGQLLYPQTQESVSNPWKYAAGYYESSTSLYKFGVRYYDPQRGRWTQQDPVGGSLASPDTLNRYVYSKDDPVNVTDARGAAVTPQCIADFIAATAAVVIAAFEGSPALIALYDAIIAGSVTNPIIGAALLATIGIIGAGAWFLQAVLYCEGVP